MEKEILDLFLFNNKLKFSEIEKKLKARSNKLAYHIKNLIKRKILQKENNFYSLSETSDYLIPYLSEKKAVLPVILIHLGSKNKVFLYKREKRPYKNYLSLPGGRLILGESINQAVKRIMKEKFSINTKLKKINSISLEHVKKPQNSSQKVQNFGSRKSKDFLGNNKIIHSFLLIFITASTKDKIVYMDINKNKAKIISSDYKLIKNNINKKINIRKIFSRD